MMYDKRTKIADSILRLERWIEGCHYRGYEPFDGLSSILRPLTLNNLFLERLLQQFVRQSPVNLRPMLGIKPQESTKGRGYMAWGYLDMFKCTGDSAYRDKAIDCLDWLDKNKAPSYSGHGWGNHFDFSSRGGRLPKHEPIIVWTSLIGQAYLDAYELLGERRYLEIATSICGWIMNVPREKTGSGTCLSYVAFEQGSIHNSNMLGAAMLARTGRLLSNGEFIAVAREAMEYSCSRQLPDGAWFYGESADRHWIDNFHTGYNLDSLKSYIESTGDAAFENHLKRGFEFYVGHFFKDDGTPKYYHARTYPIDSQCAAQAIETLAHFSDRDERALPLALKVANWTIDHMQDPSGYFYYRQYPFIKSKIPMLHWAQATTYRALALLLFNLM
jgi:rhamnogalacturonyl hydrolase YesR